jgi:hypothetical protein
MENTKKDPNPGDMSFADQSMSRDASSSTMKGGDRSMMDRTFNISGFDMGQGNSGNRPTGPGDDVIEDL